MMDFAQQKVISESTEITKTQEKEKVKSIIISLTSIASTIIFAIIIYFIGYQNMLISETKHEINIKKTYLNSLILEKQNLTKIQQSLITPKILMNENLKVANSPNVEIVH